VSGLIQGLRGQPPFDGSRFPRLPWGGQPVADDDIRFISEWIDDGLPPADGEIASFTAEGEMSATTIEMVETTEAAVTHAAVTSGDEYAYEHGEVRQRMNLDCLSEVQIDKLRFAFHELYALNKWPEDRRSYNNMALIHQNHCQHGWERFLPWHRIYLYEFEQALQDRCPDVSLPYWDWIMPQYCPRHPEKGWMIPRSYQAFLTPKSLLSLRNAEPPLTLAQTNILRENMVGKLYVRLSEFFAEVSSLLGAPYAEGRYRDRFIDALLDANPLWYPLRYPAQYTNSQGQPGTINQVIHYHYPKPEDI